MGNDSDAGLPPPDLREGGARMRRLVLALVIGAMCGGVAYLIANAAVKPGSEPQAAIVSARQMSAGSFVIWVALVTFVVTFAISLATQNAIAKRKWRASRDVPEARVR